MRRFVPVPFFSLLLALAVTALAGCGFQLRGSTSAQLPYRTVFIAVPETTDVGLWLRRYIEGSGSTQLADKQEAAEAVIQQISDGRTKSILSVNAQGAVREFRLQVTYVFRVVDAKGRVLVPPNTITVTRDMSYDASAVLAKEQEEQVLWRDISFDVVAQIMRRLSIIKPRNPDLDTEDD